MVAVTEQAADNGALIDEMFAPTREVEVKGKTISLREPTLAQAFNIWARYGDKIRAAKASKGEVKLQAQREAYGDLVRDCVAITLQVSQAQADRAVIGSGGTNGDLAHAACVLCGVERDSDGDGDEETGGPESPLD